MFHHFSSLEEMSCLLPWLGILCKPVLVFAFHLYHIISCWWKRSGANRWREWNYLMLLIMMLKSNVYFFEISPNQPSYLNWHFSLNRFINSKLYWYMRALKMMSGSKSNFAIMISSIIVCSLFLQVTFLVCGDSESKLSFDQEEAIGKLSSPLDLGFLDLSALQKESDFQFVYTSDSSRIYFSESEISYILFENGEYFLLKWWLMNWCEFNQIKVYPSKCKTIFWKSNKQAN